MTTEASVKQLIDEHFEAAISGDEAAFTALIHDDFVQEWPQSGERVRGRVACLNVYRNYPGGPPQMAFGRISGEGDHWVLEGTARYPDGSDYHTVAILEFRDGKIARETDYFGPSYPAPEWRREWVESIPD
jgi:ketosteroid isomerase-like protein